MEESSIFAGLAAGVHQERGKAVETIRALAKKHHGRLPFRGLDKLFGLLKDTLTDQVLFVMFFVLLVYFICIHIKYVLKTVTFFS